MLSYGLTLEEHFRNIVRMLESKQCPSYTFELVMEAGRFEDYLQHNKVQYTKEVTYHNGRPVIDISLL